MRQTGKRGVEGRAGPASAYPYRIRALAGTGTRFEHAHQQLRQRALSTAGFPCNAQRFAAMDPEIHAVEGVCLLVTRPSQFLRAGKFTCTLSSSSSTSDARRLSCCGYQQAACWPSAPVEIKRGVLHFAPAAKQRSRKAHPRGRWLRLGTVPGMAGRISRGSPFSGAPQRANQIGMHRMVDQGLRAAAFSHAAAYITYIRSQSCDTTAIS